MHLFLTRASIAAMTLYTQVAMACDDGKLAGDIKSCLQNPRNIGFGDMVVGGCIRAADVIRDGFWHCQSDEGARKNYNDCSADQQIATMRAVGNELRLYLPGKCGF